MRWLQGWWPSIAWDGLLRRETSLRARRLSSRPDDELGWVFFWAQKKLGIIQDLWEFRVIFWGIYGDLLEFMAVWKKEHEASTIETIGFHGIVSLL